MKTIAEVLSSDDIKALSQPERVLLYLCDNIKLGITPLDAWRKLGVYRLSDAVFKLRKVGYSIETIDCTVQNKFGEECVVACYVLNAQQ